MGGAESRPPPRAADDPGPGPGGGEPALGLQVWDVAALVRAVADALAARFAAVAVRGEVSGYSRAGSGHCYFTLRNAEGTAALRCAMFRRTATLQGFAPEEGDLVECRGRLAVYEPRGELQFVVESMRRAGAGALYERFLRLKAQLEAEGLFDASTKRRVTPHPRALGVVTSLAGAALHDVLSALRRRAPHVRLVVCPSPVQGAEAPGALAAAIAAAGRCAGVDTLLVCRGGGSLEDLWAFNEAALVRAIAASPVPVIVGIGHETDVTLADFAADLRAPTPTAAAELAALPREDALAALEGWRERAARSIAQRLDTQAQRLDRAALRLARPARSLAPHRRRMALLEVRLAAVPSRHLERQGLRGDALAARLRHALRRELERGQRATGTLAARLQALDPRQVLARGYVWLSDESGRAVGGVGRLQCGATVQAQLVDGRVRAQVTAIEPDPPAST